MLRQLPMQQHVIPISKRSLPANEGKMTNKGYNTLLYSQTKWTNEQQQIKEIYKQKEQNNT